MNKRQKVDDDTRLLYVLLRYVDYLDQASFSALTRTSPNQVSLYEREERKVPEAVLKRAADARRFPRVLLQPARRTIRSFRVASKGWSRADRVLAETFFADLLAWTVEILEVVFTSGAPAARQRLPSVPGSTWPTPGVSTTISLDVTLPSQRP